jgi:hypothetical protein
MDKNNISENLRKRFADETGNKKPHPNAKLIDLAVWYVRYAE